MSLAVSTDTPILPRRTVPRPWHMAFAVAIPVLAGLAMSLIMPRGPVTPADVIVTMLAGAVVGWSSGYLLGRWAALAAPLLFAASFELGRLGFEAPSLDIDFGSTVGVLLFAITRGLHAVVILIPMAWAALIGASARRRVGSGSLTIESIPKTSSVLLMTVIVLASVFVAWPAATAPILGANGEPVPGSIAELITVELGGQDQSIMVRGNNIENPILLYLTGGPGNSDLGYTRTFLEALEEDFVVVAWEQRGVGKSYPALDPVSSLTVESAVSDVVDLSRYLTDRFGQEKIYLFGNSWGSIIGILAAEQRPDLYHAYIGAGQMVNPLQTDRYLHWQMTEYAEQVGDEELLDRMIGYGEPPYSDLNGYMTVIEHYGVLEPYEETAEFARGVPGIQGTSVSEYGFMDKLNVFRGLVDMGGALYPQAQGLDLRSEAPALDVPVYFIQGAHELTARADLAKEYASTLRAPSVEVEVFERSGHIPHFEEAARFHRYLVDVVAAETGR